MENRAKHVTRIWSTRRKSVTALPLQYYSISFHNTKLSEDIFCQLSMVKVSPGSLHYITPIIDVAI